MQRGREARTGLARRNERKRTGRVGIALALAAISFAGLLLLTLALLVDSTVMRWDDRAQALVPSGGWTGRRGLVVDVAVLVGQRGLVAPVALAAALWLSWKARRPRPVLVLAGALVALSGLATALKQVTGRLAPAAGADALHAGGQSYPSGHTAGALVAYGVVALLLTGPDGPLPGRHRVGLLTAAAALGLLPAVGVVLRDFHWVSDSVAGYLLGAAVVAVAACCVPRARTGPRGRASPQRTGGAGAGPGAGHACGARPRSAATTATTTSHA